MIYLIPDPLNLVQVVDVKILCSNTPEKATISELNKLLNPNTEVRSTLHSKQSNRRQAKPDLQ